MTKNPAPNPKQHSAAKSTTKSSSIKPPSPGVPVLREMIFTQAVTPIQAGSCMEHLASSSNLGQIGFEIRARGEKEAAPSLRWYMAAGKPRIADLDSLVRAHLPVQTRARSRVRREPQLAVSVRLRGTRAHLDPSRIEQAAKNLYTVLGTLRAEDELTIQLLLGHRHSPPIPFPDTWAEFFRVLMHPERPSGREKSPNLRHRREQHGFDSSLRIGASASTVGHARHLISQVRDALKVLETASTTLRLKNLPPKRILTLRRGWRWPLRLSSGEAASVAGWPVGDGELPVYGSGHPQLAPPPATLPPTERTLGVSAAPGFEKVKIGYSLQDAAYHSHLLGPTGVGKSTAMLNLIAHDMAVGASVVVLDPKGDLADDILAHIPADRRPDVVVLDATADTVVGLNPLQAPRGMEAQTADHLLAVFEGLDSRPWGVGVRQTLSTAIHTLVRVPGSTLLDVIPLLTDPGFRRQILAQVTDDSGLEFWQQFEAMTPAKQQEAIAPVLRRLHPIQLRPSLRAILGQSEPRFDLRELFTSRKILIVNLNKGVIGAEPARLLGNLLIGMIWQHTLTRQKLPRERRHVISLHIDEAHDFISGLGAASDLTDILAQARSLGVALHLANQHLNQFTPKVAEAVLSNARNRIYLPLSGKDARTIAKTFGGLEPADYEQLPAYHAQAQLMHRGRQTPWMTIQLSPAPQPVSDPAEVAATAQENYAVPVDEVSAAQKQRTGSKAKAHRSTKTEAGFGGRAAS